MCGSGGRVRPRRTAARARQSTAQPHCRTTGPFTSNSPLRPALQTLKDGKPIIIEGLHLDPGLYLDEFGRHGMVGMGGTFSLELPPEATATAALLGAQQARQAGKVRAPWRAGALQSVQQPYC